MHTSRILSSLIFALLSLASVTSVGQAANSAPTTVIPAFPGAEGYGAQSVGGRGGKVMEVTNLNDSGAGSLRACIEASDPRICVFRLGGTITVNSNMDIVNPFITIAGQTAPGGGITLKASGNTVGSPIRVRTHDVIIRFLRSRPGTTGLDNRALSIGNKSNPPYNVIVDHSSFSWSGDEVVIVWYNTQKVTLQWNIISESLPCTDDSFGLKGPNLGSDGGGNYSLHHNLIAHHSQRSPNISTSGGPVDVVNNLVYDPGGIGARVLNSATVNFVRNYIEAGPNTHTSAYVKDDGAGGLYLTDNVVEGKGIIQSFLPTASAGHVVAQSYSAPHVTTTSADVAYNQVLDGAGASLGLTCDGSLFQRRDPVDVRVVQSVREDTRGHPGDGYLRSPLDVGGWPTLASGTPCPDDDHDGMPNEWEIARGLDRTQNDSVGDLDGDGYTNIEEYINASDPNSSANILPKLSDGPPQLSTERVYLPLVRD